MKRLIGLIVAMVMVCFVSPAMALTGVEGCPNGDANAFHADSDLPNQNICLGKVEISDLGTFNPNGSFTWANNTPLMADLDSWMSISTSTWRDDHTPTQAVQPTYSRFDVRTFPDGRRDSRIVYQGGLVQSIPQIWKVTAPDGAETGPYFMVWWNPPEGCIDWSQPECNNPSTTFPMENILANSFKASDFTGVSWNGLTAGVMGGYKSDYVFLKYDTDSNELFDTGYGTRQTEPEIYFAPFAAVPAEPGPQTVNFSMIDGTSFSLTFDVPSVEVMPTVAAKSYYEALVAEDKKGKKGKSKSKKKVKATLETVEVDNLTARELEDALVIQWAEPEGALNRPDMRLRMYVGDNWNLPNGSYEYDTFIFADCPVQTGTVVIPAYIWQPFKTKMRDDIGYSDVTVAGMYRYQSGDEIGSHNRGYFEGIKFPIVP